MNKMVFARYIIFLAVLLWLSGFYSKEIIAEQNKITGYKSSTNKIKDMDISLYKLWRSYRAEKYTQPSSTDLKNANIIFLNLFKVLTNATDNSDKVLTGNENDQFFHVSEKNLLGNSLIVVTENHQQRTGSGFYVFRRNGNGVMLQAPHAFKDLHTGSLAIKLMLEGNYSGLALNTVPRKFEIARKEINADVAHLDISYFMSVSLEFSRYFPEGQVIQLHGYNSDRRDETRNTSMIISAGSKALVSQVIRQQSCLVQTLTEKVLVYPRDINLLGGTTNTIGRALRKSGYSGFRHFEMNLPLRKKMLKSRKGREAFTQCILNR